MSVEAQVRSHILEDYLFTDDQSKLGNDDSFLDKGILDSTGMLEVIHFLEDEFEISVEDEEMVPENLDSVSKIVAYVARKQS